MAYEKLDRLLARSNSFVRWETTQKHSLGTFKKVRRKELKERKYVIYYPGRSEKVPKDNGGGGRRDPVVREQEVHLFGCFLDTEEKKSPREKTLKVNVWLI